MIASNLQEVYQDHPEKYKLSEPIQVWCSLLHEPLGPASFIPLMRIYQICASCEVKLNHKRVLLINPVRNKKFL